MEKLKGVIYNSGNGKEIGSASFQDTFSAIEFMTGVVLDRMGHGDMENGGKGSLVNCREDIKAAFRSIENPMTVSTSYSYADEVFILKRE